MVAAAVLAVPAGAIEEVPAVRAASEARVARAVSEVPVAPAALAGTDLLRAGTAASVSAAGDTDPHPADPTAAAAACSR